MESREKLQKSQGIPSLKSGRHPVSEVFKNSIIDTGTSKASHYLCFCIIHGFFFGDDVAKLNNFQTIIKFNLDSTIIDCKICRMFQIRSIKNREKTTKSDNHAVEAPISEHPKRQTDFFRFPAIIWSNPYRKRFKRWTAPISRHQVKSLMVSTDLTVQC